MSDPFAGSGPGSTPEAPDPDNQRRRMAPWVRVVLFVSLALNIAVIGLVVGAAIKGPPRPAIPRDYDRIGGVFSFAMDPEDRREIGHALYRDLRDSHPSRQEFRDSIREIVTALKTMPYDPKVLEKNMDLQLDALVHRQTLARDLLAQHIAQMTPAERRAFAERLQEAVDHPPVRAKKAQNCRPVEDAPAN